MGIIILILQTSVTNQPTHLARLAQSVERKTLIQIHLEAVGSTPTSGSIPDACKQRFFLRLFLIFRRLVTSQNAADRLATRLTEVSWGETREGQIHF